MISVRNYFSAISSLEIHFGPTPDSNRKIIKNKIPQHLFYKAEHRSEHVS